LPSRHEKEKERFMSPAALTPRVRIMVVCDNVIPDELEGGVFTLERARQHLSSASFPFFADLNLFLLLSSARKVTYPGKVVLLSDDDDKTVRYAEFEVTFTEDNEVLPTYLELARCRFPELGPYTFEVWFTAPSGEETRKGELPFFVHATEE
jgi:hypothetical protein